MRIFRLRTLGGPITVSGGGGGSGDATEAKQDQILSLLSAIGAGTGARTVSVTVNDGSDPVQSASVRFTKGVETYIQTTDANGECSFAIDDGTWSVSITRAGYTFTPTTLAVSGDQSETYSLSSLALTPSDPGKVTGFVTCYDRNGDLQEGVSITCFACSTGTATGVALDAAERTVVSNASGIAEFPNLIIGVTYRFYRGDIKKAQDTTIPSGSATPFVIASFHGLD